MCKYKVYDSRLQCSDNNVGDGRVGGETNAEESRSVRNSLKDMPDITLASVNCMADMRTGQDIDRFWYHHIRRSEISCNGYEIM